MFRICRRAHHDVVAGHRCRGQSLGGQSVSVHREGAAVVPRCRGRRRRRGAAQLRFHKWETKEPQIYEEKGKLTTDNSCLCVSSASESRDEGTTWLLVSSRLAPDDGEHLYCLEPLSWEPPVHHLAVVTYRLVLWLCWAFVPVRLTPSILWHPHPS